MFKHGQRDSAERFEELTLPYVDALYRAAYHLTGLADEAEDLTQETYLKAYRAFDSFHGQNIKAWLFAILRNTFVDDYRQRQRAPAFLDIEALDFSLDGSDGHEAAREQGADAPLLASLLDDELQTALETLPAEWRLIVLLADLEDFSYQEIADITQVPIGTVMSRLHRGRKRLYEHLYDYARAAGYLKEERRR